MSLAARCFGLVAACWLVNAAALLALADIAALSLRAPLAAAAAGLLLLPLAFWLLAPLRADLGTVARVAADGAASPMVAPRSRTREVAELMSAVQQLRARSDGLLDLQRGARRQVEEAERLRTSFLAAMGHDLRGPLNAIIGFSELLVMDDHDAVAPAQRPSIDIIRRSAQDLVVLLDQILDWARLEAGQLGIDRRPVVIESVIAEAVEEARSRAGDRGLQVQLDVAPGLPVLQADPDRLRQALLGLLDYATRVPGRPIVHLRVRVLGPDDLASDRLQIELRDPQLRIRDADRDTFFQAFRPSYEPTGRRLGGLGLGPALARALLRAHGGTVWLASRSDTGTTFTVELPLQEPPPEPAQEPHSAVSSAPAA
jgi:signal transduction histidine kinase